MCRSESELESVIEPGHSGIVALVSDPAASNSDRPWMAESIVQTAIDDVVAKDVMAAAKEAEDAEEAAVDAPGDARPWSGGSVRGGSASVRSGQGLSAGATVVAAGGSSAATRASPMNAPYRSTGQPDLSTSRS